MIYHTKLVSDTQCENLTLELFSEYLRQNTAALHRFLVLFLKYLVYLKNMINKILAQLKLLFNIFGDQKASTTKWKAKFVLLWKCWAFMTEVTIKET